MYTGSRFYLLRLSQIYFLYSRRKREDSEDADVFMANICYLRPILAKTDTRPQLLLQTSSTKFRTDPSGESTDVPQGHTDRQTGRS
jgi:hypothetical protein